MQRTMAMQYNANASPRSPDPPVSMHEEKDKDVKAKATAALQRLKDTTGKAADKLKAAYASKTGYGSRTSSSRLCVC